TTPAGLAYFVDRYRDHFHATAVDEVVLYPEYAIVTRPAGGPRSKHRVTFRRAEFQTPDSSSTRTTKKPPFDLAAMDLRAVAALIAGAPRTLGGAVQYLNIEYPPGNDESGPVMVIYAKNADGGVSGHMSVSLAGEPLEIYRSGG
ncbi:MAG: DUF1707 domain-containing protein, partial [Mycobacteriaceae bacterium]|nr:DUF1707 domain-containing protein [Mycobacteriaceae bacterium]